MSVLANLVSNRVWLLHSSLDVGMVCLEEATFSSLGPPQSASERLVGLVEKIVYKQ